MTKPVSSNLFTFIAKKSPPFSGLLYSIIFSPMPTEARNVTLRLKLLSVNFIITVIIGFCLSYFQVQY